MTKETLISKTLNTLNKLPKEKAMEVSDFAEFILKKYDEEILQRGIEKLTTTSKSFKFLKNEDDLYSLKDLKKSFK